MNLCRCYKLLCYPPRPIFTMYLRKCNNSPPAIGFRSVLRQRISRGTGSIRTPAIRFNVHSAALDRPRRVHPAKLKLQAPGRLLRTVSEGSGHPQAILSQQPHVQLPLHLRGLQGKRLKCISGSTMLPTFPEPATKYMAKKDRGTLGSRKQRAEPRTLISGRF